MTALQELLTLGEYNRLARLLRERQKQPADLIGLDATEAIALVAALQLLHRAAQHLGGGLLELAQERAQGAVALACDAQPFFV